ncbi:MULTISPECIES: alpha-2-macroglobulin family protein [unclassified Gilliamella]|uniref:alpha-2-macroglobulin family protein n=1 Tax=unclassified Gilliamella TaxID=2685620 RepID=UPI0013256B57|nr:MULTISPECIES: alpha-2-macroglobulin [unclassified Gilliamella]MWN31110.1 alpha-2-macroglobulin family protein [Gilliamella sp. Pra-s60]MWP28325.1 alpha-2-macroglobulin family protein [Gilliamella sp. Pra-s54]
MGLLKLILQLPFYILQKAWEIVSYFLLFLLVLAKGIFWLFSPIIGDIKWSTPSWLPNVKNFYYAIGFTLNKIKTFIGASIIFSFIAYFSGNYAYHWYLNRPKPIEPAPIVINKYSANLYSPSTDDYTLLITFTGDNRPPSSIKSVKKKEITEGVNILPNIEGKWTWSDDSTISFTPKDKKWPIGAIYTVVLDPSKLLDKNCELIRKNKTFTFTTPKFEYNFKNYGELYSDPTELKIRNVINTIQFSHPVDRNSFEKNITLSLYEDNTFLKNVDFKVTYENNDKIAYVKSADVPLLDKAGYLRMTINKGVTSTLGGNPLDFNISNAVNIPDKYHLNITKSELTLVEKSNEKIQQVLVLSLTHAVKSEDLSKLVKVWKLPKNPDSPYKERYYNSYSSSYETKFNVTPEILKKATPLSIKPIDTELAYQNQISFELKTEQNSELYIEVNQPLSSQEGYFLKGQYQEILTVPNYPTYLDFAASGSLLSLSGDKKLPIVSRNIEQMKLEIDRVIPSQLQHLVAFNESYEFNDMNFGELDNDHFVEKYSITKDFTGAPEEVKYTNVDLTRYLTANTNGNKNRGVFLLRLYGKDKKDTKYEFMASRFIVVTDLGIIAKKSLDQSNDLFIQSINSGAPISGAKVSVLGMNGITITSQKTDSNGHVHFAPLSEYYKGIKPLLYVVEKERDLSFLPIKSYERNLNLSRFDIGGIRETLEGGELRSHIFSDRGIYRPGDTFHIGTIVRAQKWTNSLEGITIEAEIYDPKSNLVLKKSIVLDKSGFNELSYKTNYESPTGDWYINLYLKNDDEESRILLGSSSVSVREFEPDKTAVSLKLLPEIKEGWLKPEEIQAEIKAKNLFGTDAANRRVTNTLILEPSTPYFKKYEDYYFYQNTSGVRNSFKVELDEQTTDENGIVKINLNDNMQSFEGNYTLRMLTDVFEPDSGRSVAATASTFVSPNDYLVGAKTDGNLRYINKDSVRHIDFIAINPALEKIELSDLKLVLIEEKYLSVLVKQSSGVYKYESRRKESLLSEQPFKINQDKTRYQLDSKNPGNYIIQIKNKKDELLYQSKYSIVGTANVTRDLDRNAELSLKIKDAQYNPGDEIEVSITAPYVGSGIITIERDKVYAWKWFHTDTTSSIQKITLPKDIGGNGYINVQFIRDPNSDEIFMSPLSYGVIPFKISNEQFNDKIVLQVPSLIKPGDTLPITLHTNTPQKAVVFAVDEGILQVSNYKLKDPLNSFLRKKALSVRTSQILDLILPEFRHLITASAPGGDGDNDDVLSNHLNPFKRKIDEPVAYWSGIIDVDGDKTVEYKVPDYFNGKIRIMAVSVGDKTMGHTQMSTTVHNDIVLQPNAPYFAAPNDEFEVSLNVTNLIENIGDKVIPIDVKVSTTPNLSIIDDNKKTIELANAKTGVLKFRFKATDKLGNGDLHFSANYNDITITRDISLSIRPLTEYRLITRMGRMADHKQTFTDFRDMYSNLSKREAAASYSPFILSKGLSTYLQDYPHYCSEQIVSRAIPILIASKYKEFDLASKEGIAPLSELFQVLQSRQNSEGAIGLWYSTYNVNPFITLYAVNFMLEAKEMGYKVPKKMLDNANKYLQTIAESSSTSTYGLRVRSYAIYLLTRQNQVTTSYLASIMRDLNQKEDSWKKDITAMYLASSYKMLKMDKEANKLIKPVWQQLETAYNHAWWTNNYYDPLVVNAGKIHLISKHFPEKAKDIPAQALENMVIMLNKQKYTTQSAAMTILALSSYSLSIDKLNLSNDTLQINAVSKDTEKQKIIANLNGILAKGKFSVQDEQLNIINKSNLPAWYMLSEQGYDKTPPNEPIKRGLEVYREYTDLDGKPVEQVKLGDKINVTVQIRALANEGMTNIAIVDLLPAGFEVVQQAITPKEDNNDEYMQEYDDECEECEDYEDYEDDEDDEDDGYHDWVSPIAIKTDENTWYPEYADVREDRVIIYGSTHNDKIQKFTYQIKATNVGTYSIPPAFGEAMYDRDVQAVSKGGQKISIISQQ